MQRFLSNETNNECNRYLGAPETPFKKKKKDSGTILETSNIKSVRSALNFQSLFGL